MAKLSPVQKEARVLKLLMGLRNPRIRAPMVSRGFQYEDAEEGWQLLRNTGKLPFDIALPVEADPSLVSWLDQWENVWFPVADATLKRNFPEIHERVFLNLSQTEGPAVIVSVGTFVDRVSSLCDGGERRQKALKLLARRGLTAAVLDVCPAMQPIESMVEAPEIEDAMRVARDANDCSFYTARGGGEGVGRVAWRRFSYQLVRELPD